MNPLVSHLDALTNATSIESLWGMHMARMAEYGFDRLIYGFTRYRFGASLGDPQDWVVLTNQPETYMKPFVEDGLFFHAPMVR